MNKTSNKIPITIVMITLNEAHNLRECLDNIHNNFESVVIVDSYSCDKTIDIALDYGVLIYQRKFKSYGDQWNFAINQTNIKTPWTMKIDPDERLTKELIDNLRKSCLNESEYNGITINRRLWFMDKPLNINQKILRVWKTGTCTFSNVSVNEYPIVSGKINHIAGNLEHLDSPSIEDWIFKQNKYTSLEAESILKKKKLSFDSKILGNNLERRMWIKNNFWKFPLRYEFLYMYLFFRHSIWKKGIRGFVWLRLRVEVYRQIEMKTIEMRLCGVKKFQKVYGQAKPDKRVRQF